MEIQKRRAGAANPKKFLQDDPNDPFPAFAKKACQASAKKMLMTSSTCQKRRKKNMEVVWNSIIHIFGVFEEVGGFLEFVKGLLLVALTR